MTFTLDDGYLLLGQDTSQLQLPKKRNSINSIFNLLII